MRRNNPYEADLESALLRLGVCVLPTQETRLAEKGGRHFKNLDLIVFRPGLVHGLIEVKGRAHPDPWFTKGDLANLRGWQSIFDDSFLAGLVFVFRSAAPDAHFHGRGFSYQAWLLPLNAAERLAQPRSERWATLGIPRAAFRREALPFLEWALASKGKERDEAPERSTQTAVQERDSAGFDSEFDYAFSLRGCAPEPIEYGFEGA